MTTIQHLQGNAAQPQGDGKKIIAHGCNDSGTWEWGFARTLNRTWPQAKVAYKAWYKELGYRLALGTTQLVERDDSDVMIANMIVRRGIKFLPVQPLPLDYGALEKCLVTVTNRARYFEASVHLPCIGDRDRFETLVEKTLVAGEVVVFVYDS